MVKLKKNDWISLGIALLVPQLAGGIGAVATASSVKTWYKELRKPSWTPPGWLFGPVWTALYLMMGVASWLIWRAPGQDRMEDTPLALPESRESRNALAFYTLQLGLNTLWSVLFFGVRSLRGALVEIGILWGMLASTVYSFYKLRPAAGLLMIPYLAWSSFAAVLNATVWKMNR